MNKPRKYIRGAGFIENYRGRLPIQGTPEEEVGFYSYAGQFTNTNTSQTFTSETFVDVTGTAGDITPNLTASKTYGIMISAKLKTDATLTLYE